MRKELISKSKLLSLVLRHDPDAIGISLDAHGWASVQFLLSQTALHGKPITPAELLEIVETNEKRRFELDEGGTRIRASQGHSIEVDVELTVTAPPSELFHGTAARFLASIRTMGLVKQSRQHVHLSPDAATARAVGSRHGTPVVLRIASGLMAQEGHVFFRSKNGVWLTDAVPAQFIIEL